MRATLSALLCAALWAAVQAQGKTPIDVVLALPRNPGVQSPEINEFRLSLAQAEPVIALAQDRIRELGLLPRHRFNIREVDTECSDIVGTYRIIEAYKRDEMDMILGFACTYPMAPIARISAMWQKGIPLLTTVAMTSQMDDRDQYRLLTRLSGSYKTLGAAVSALAKHFDWKRLGFYCHQYDPSKNLGNSECMFQLSEVRRLLKNTVAVELDEGDLVGQPFDMYDDTEEDLRKGLQKITMASNIIVLCAPNQDVIRKLMLMALDMGMVDGRYFILNIDISTGSFDKQPWQRDDASEEENQKAKEAFKAMKVISLRQPESSEYSAFVRQAKIRAKSMGKAFKMNNFISAFFDAMMLYAIGVNETLAAGRPFDDGVHVTSRMWNRTFKGISGNITMDSQGDRISDYAILGYSPETDRFEEMAKYDGSMGQLYETGKAWYWPGEEAKPPSDEPVCGWDQSKCPDEVFPLWAILLIAFGVFFLVFLTVALLVFRYFKLESELAAMTWRIRWEELSGEEQKKLNSKKAAAANHTGKTTEKILAKMDADVTNPLLEKRDSLCNKSLCSVETIALQADQQVFTKTAKYNGTIVAIKKLNIHRAKIELSRSMLVELKNMRDLQHDHITRFVGACVDAPNFCIVTEYASKGSLQDLLENESLEMDKMMIYSLIHDLVKGLDFIHHSSGLKSHGNLKSSNCVVDSRFVLKVTDFGLHSLRRLQETPEDEGEESHVFWRRLLWTSPELLRLEERPEEGTIKGDVFAFGVILHEMSFRQGPFYLFEENLEPRQIVDAVRAGRTEAGDVLRPYTESETQCDPEIVTLMQQCWAESAHDRPDVSYLRRRIRALNRKFETGNIVDNLLKRMEQYANNLEGLVQERTSDYVKEKEKVEELLHQLLPKSVAATLIRNEQVKSESFDRVTIYFSDIVGFTALSSSSTPMEVVALLNDLYTVFDSVIGHFDVYKVETIGDAYMVVSGLPERIGDRHAPEIAKMSLALLARVRTFVIRHKPEEQLKLRIGMHSGSVCAGVVGVKMPRYCLFGDTVNTASRMESNGLPLKIHVSSTTQTILDEKFPGAFELEFRGEVEMKGKGLQKTYWLNGYNPPAQLPQTAAVAALAQAEDSPGLGDSRDSLPAQPLALNHHTPARATLSEAGSRPHSMAPSDLHTGPLPSQPPPNSHIVFADR